MASPTIQHAYGTYSSLAEVHIQYNDYVTMVRKTIKEHNLYDDREAVDFVLQSLIEARTSKL